MREIHAPGRDPEFPVGMLLAWMKKRFSQVPDVRRGANTSKSASDYPPRPWHEPARRSVPCCSPGLLWGTAEGNATSRLKRPSQRGDSIDSHVAEEGKYKILSYLIASLPRSIIYSPLSSKMASIGTLYLSDLAAATPRVSKLFASIHGTS